VESGRFTTNGSGGDGAFYPGDGLGTRAYQDGMSKTLMLAEVKAYNPYFRNLGSATDPLGLVTKPHLPIDPKDIPKLGGDFKDSSGHTEWVDGRTHQCGFTTTLTPNTKVLHTVKRITYDVDWTNWQELKDGVDGKPTYAAVTARSYHPGAINAALMDGSVHTIAESVDLIVWRAMATRAGGETFELP
jgi:hypothetical protein